MDRGDIQGVAVAGAKLLFIETSPMWMEKFIATAQRYGIFVADAEPGRQYDLLKPEDEAAFRALGKSEASQ